MEKKGKELIFISRIKRDGSGVVQITNSDVIDEEKEVFKINRLSITEDTYIASGFYSYVVKLRK